MARSTQARSRASRSFSGEDDDQDGTDRAFTGVHGQLDLADPPLHAGDVAGDLVIEGLLGEGSFGRVYRAVHPVIGKQAAVKVLRASLRQRPDAARRFLNEARAVGRIQNDHIVKVYGCGSLPDGRLFYAMELCEGSTLEERIRSEGKLARADALTVLAQLARALDAAHLAGITHRDVKPDNVVVCAEESGALRVKLLDFGIAKLAEEAGPELGVTTKGVQLGTPAYMSPEQIRGEPVSPRADVYALGVLAFELLTGRLPFRGFTPIAVMTEHLSETPPRASSIDPTLPEGIDAALAAMLAKRPEDRPPSARVAVQALLDAEPSGAEPTQASPSMRPVAPARVAARARRTVDPLAATLPALSRRRRWAGRSPLVAALVATMVALVSIVLAALRRAT